MVLTQYKSHSRDRHIATTWRMSPLLGNYVTPVPAQMRPLKPLREDALYPPVTAAADTGHLAPGRRVLGVTKPVW